MDNFIFQSPYFHLVELILYFTLFKISLPVIHSNSLQILVIEIQESSLFLLVNLIRYRGIMGIFDNCHFGSKSLSNLYFI